MREILSRGKRENGGWVYGYAVKKAYHNGYYIITHASSSDCVNETGLVSGAWKGYEDIIPETIGRDTGLTDKNGTKIFEGDIVKIEPVKHKEEIQIQGRNYKISELKGCWIMLNDEEKWEFLGSIANSVVVVSNIYDNPELLEV